MSSRLHSLIVVAFIALLACWSATASYAQDNQIGRSPALLPGEADDLLRAPPRTDANGIRAGSFVLLPSIAASIVLDDNVFATRSGRRSDVYWRVDPELRIVSDWSRHAMEIYAAGTGLAYDTFDSETRTEFRGGVSSLIEIRRDLWVRSFAKLSSGHEERGIGESINVFEKPVHFSTFESGTLIHKRFNRLWLEGSGRWRRDNYDDATLDGPGGSIVVDQDFRDGWRAQFVVRGGYEFSDKVSAFVETGYDVRDHTDEQFNSSGTRVLAGLRYEFTRFLYGEAAIGRMHQDVAAGKAKIDDLTFRAKVRWEPSPFYTVSVIASRELASPTQSVAASNNILTQAGLRLDYAPRRNLTLSMGAAYMWQEYVDIGQTEQALRATVGAEYHLNRVVSLFGNYAFTAFESVGLAGVEFDRNVAAAGIRARY